MCDAAAAKVLARLSPRPGCDLGVLYRLSAEGESGLEGEGVAVGGGKRARESRRWTECSRPSWRVRADAYAHMTCVGVYMCVYIALCLQE